jgi:hypothetical protein
MRVIVHAVAAAGIQLLLQLNFINPSLLCVHTKKKNSEEKNKKKKTRRNKYTFTHRLRMDSFCSHS